MSRSHGTGQPAFPRCWRCRRSRNHNPFYTDAEHGRLGTEQRMKLTGKRRYSPNYNGGRVDVFYQYEYTCLDCGYVGWTRHINIARRWASHYEPTTEAAR